MRERWKPTLTILLDLPHGAAYVKEGTLCSMRAGSRWRKQTGQSTSHSHPEVKPPRQALFNIARGTNRTGIGLMQPPPSLQAVPLGSSVAPLQNSRTYNYVRRVTCSSPSATLPRTILLSSAAREKMPAELWDSSLRPKNIHSSWPTRSEIVPCCLLL